MCTLPRVFKALTAIALLYGVTVLAATTEHADELIVDNELTLQALVEKSFLAYPSTPILAAQKQVAAASQLRAQGWTPSPASLVARNQNDRLFSGRGELEWEAGVELPLWLSGQKKARAALASLLMDTLKNDEAALRLQMAGLVRDALWDIELRRELALTAKAKWDSAVSLQNDVQTRVKFGDLAYKESLVAQTETLQAQAEHINAQAELAHAQFRYINLTGFNKIPVNFSEKISAKTELDDQHPALNELAAKLALAAQRRILASFESRENPTLTFGVRRVRDARDVKYNNSIGITLKIPLSPQSHSTPLMAMAELQHAEQLANIGNLKRVLNAALHEAEHNLEIGVVQLEVLSKQNDIAKKNSALAHKAFALGELDLSELVRIQAQSFATERLLKTQQIQQSWNAARFNQAVGELP
jgi:outer membrane protein, heavy metal efflux system